MARQIHLTQSPLGTSQTVLSAVTSLFCAFALSMCASHSRKWRCWSTCYGSCKLDPVIQVNTLATMISTEVPQTPTGESMFSGEQGVSVWQKNIPMSGKCQLPDFSGVTLSPLQRIMAHCSPGSDQNFEVFENLNITSAASMLIFDTDK